jgi:hypothetical protein
VGASLTVSVKGTTGPSQIIKVGSKASGKAPGLER